MSRTTYPNLKKRRKQLGLTLEDVAKRVGVNQSTVSRWETGNIENMRQSQIIKLADALKTSPLWIMGYELDEAYYQDLLSKLIRVAIETEDRASLFHEDKDNAKKRISDLVVLTKNVSKLNEDNLKIVIGYTQFLIAEQEK